MLGERRDSIFIIDILLLKILLDRINQNGSTNSAHERYQADFR